MPPRVLIVDDAADVRQVHAHFLHGSGMEVFTAENGALALEAARRTVPDVIVTDVTMPVMDGIDLCRQLRSDEATRSVVIVVVTGDPENQERAAIEAGCDALIGKPCSRARLLATIRQLLETR